MHPLSREFIQQILHPTGRALSIVPAASPPVDPRAAIARILHPGPAASPPEPAPRLAAPMP